MWKATHTKSDGQVTSQFAHNIVDKIISTYMHSIILISSIFLGIEVRVIRNYYLYVARFFS